jgi:integrase
LKSKWTDVDWDFRTLFVGLAKNGEPVLAPLSDAAVLRLQQIPRLENNEFIICGKNPGTHLVGLRHIWHRIRTAADLPDVRLHYLRRTVGSWLVQHGESLHLVGQILNHRDTKNDRGVCLFSDSAARTHGETLLKFAPGTPATPPAAVYSATATIAAWPAG